jgi:hypothetical protein
MMREFVDKAYQRRWTVRLHKFNVAPADRQELVVERKA